MISDIIEFGDCRDIRRKWKDEGVKVQMCVTSPPYYGLRSYLPDTVKIKENLSQEDFIYLKNEVKKYNIKSLYKKSEIPQHLFNFFEPAEIGLEETPEEYIQNLVEVFRCVWDILEDDGVLWVNIGDSYAGSGKGANPDGTPHPSTLKGKQGTNRGTVTGINKPQKAKSIGLKSKDLIGIPWMMAFALRSDGWYLRQDIIWSKPNPMPESVKDRCTKSHEYIFLLSKNPKYFYDYDSIKIDASNATLERNSNKFNCAFKGQFKGTPGENRYQDGKNIENPQFSKDGRANKRSVWTVTPKPYRGAHFATFPPELIEPCILAGSRINDIVLDPFMGSGTTAMVAQQHQRRYLGCELNKDYEQLQKDRIHFILPL